MAIKIDKSKDAVSATAWGDVDKSAMGSKLAEMYAAGDATKAQIKEVYAFVPDEAFTTDSNDKPKFLASKAWGPYCELKGDTVVINRGGLGGAAAACGGSRSTPSLSAGDLATAKKNLKRAYKAIGEDVPSSLSEARKKIGKGKELTELVKGSLEYTMSQVSEDFNDQFKQPNPNYPGMWVPWYIVDTFADYVVVAEKGGPMNGMDDCELESDEFFQVGFTLDAASGEYTFDTKDKWQVVELTYQPSTTPPDEPMMESRATGDKKSKKRFVERMNQVVKLTEAVEGKPRKVKAIGITADVVNENGRRYPARVLAKAVNELRSHLNESAGQGRLLQMLGEVDHPSDKSGRPNLLETVVRWDAVEFDGEQNLLEGTIIPTSQGKDLSVLLEHGVNVGISQRAYGDSAIVKENGRTIEEVTELHITGYDFVMEPSDPNGRVTLFESRQQNGDEDMTPEQLKELIGKNPDLFKGLLKEDLDKMGADALKTLEESVRKVLGIDANADMGKALQEAVEAKRTMDEAKRKASIDAAIDAATKGLPYGEALNKQFVEAVKAANPQDEAAVKTLVEAKRKEYDGFAAQAKLRGMGFDVKVVGPVIEEEIGVPAYAAGAQLFTESLIRHGSVRQFNQAKPKNINESFAAQVLAMYDKQNRGGLMREAKMLEEAETAADLSLPYSVSRAIIAAVWPMLIATSVFDTAPTDQAPSKIFYETYARESGADKTVSAEDVTASDPLGDYVDLAQKNLKPGTVVVTNVGAGTTYTEGDDYVIDYFNGRLKALASPGTITAAEALKVSYGYLAIAKGEMVGIERGKMTLASKTLEIAARRLAQQISTEAVVFSRSQIGWDATTKTLAALVKDVTRKIDGDLFYLSLASALGVASNSGGSWSKSSGKLEDLIAYIGLARQKVVDRFYEPTAILMSSDISSKIGTMVTSTGYFLDSSAQKSAANVVDANGYARTIDGLPVFASTEHSSSYIQVVAKEIVAYRIYQAMQLKGPYPSYDSNGLLVAADQWYAEQFDGAESPIPSKAAYVVLT